MTSGRRSMLVTTIAARDGGVPTMLRFALPLLRRMGWETHLAYYEPYSQTRTLSVPLLALGRRNVGVRPDTGIDGTPATAVGAWLPEFEFTHYRPTRHWRTLIDSHEANLVISGTAVAGDALTCLGRPFVAWIATDLDGDRRDRVAGFPWYRKVLDTALNRHMLRRIERRVLNQGRVLALSQYTRRALNQRVGSDVVSNVLPSPVDTGVFMPLSGATVPGRIGFSGRLDDPRKNLPLLLDAFRNLLPANPAAELHLIGYRPGTGVETLLQERGIAQQTRLLPYVAHSELPKLLNALDVFVVPSHQEGLCLAALEAMACGVPIVSTRCGGPEEFVVDGETGYLTDSDPLAMSSALSRIVSDRSLRARLALGAQNLVERSYSVPRAEGIMAQALDSTFSNLSGSSHT